jgi:uncharacterized protein (TIGR03083 family)
MYAETRGRITELVNSLSPEQLEGIAPAAPLWRVRDVVAHLSGAVADILAGNLDGVATDAWTAAQVDARREQSVADILDEWNENAPKVEAMVNNFGSAGVQLVADEVTHEHDIRGAVALPGARDSDAADAALQWLIDGLGQRLPSGLRLAAGNQEWVIGPGEPAATVTAPDEFEVLRALIGRRSAAQVAAWHWDGDPTPYLPVLAPWGLRDTDLVE